MSLSDADITTIVEAFTGSGFGRLLYESEAATLNLHRGSHAAAFEQKNEPVLDPERREIIAPCLGLLRRKAVAGRALAEDDVIAELDVLGVCHPVTATKAGRLREWAAEDGSLVEWGAPIATLEIE